MFYVDCIVLIQSIFPLSGSKGVKLKRLQGRYGGALHHKIPHNIPKNDVGVQRNIHVKYSSSANSS